MKVGLISCTKNKKEGAHRAEKLYDSALFKKSLDYSLREFDDIKFLSAKHHVLDPREEIEEYDKTLKDMKQEEKKEWSKKVATELEEEYSRNDTLFFLTGKDYYKYVINQLEIPYHVPMEGLGIGEKLHWLNKELSRTLFFSSYINDNFFPRQIMSYDEANDGTLDRCRTSFIDSGILKDDKEIKNVVRKQKKGDFFASVDVMEDVDKTIDNTLKWENMVEDFSERRKVYVLQGEDKRDYMRCFKELRESIDDMKYLGLGGLIKKDGRKVKQILSLVPELKEMGYFVHIFGIGTNYVSLIKEAEPHSWDTSTPVRDAIEGTIYTNTLNKRNLGEVNSEERGQIAMWNARKVQDYLDNGGPEKNGIENLDKFT